MPSQPAFADDQPQQASDDNTLSAQSDDQKSLQDAIASLNGTQDAAGQQLADTADSSAALLNTNNSASQQSAEPSQDHNQMAKHLPQTGNAKSQGIIGLGLAGFLAALGLAGYKKRQN